MIRYLKTLGITTLELLPVQFHVDEPQLQKMGLSNYWGYNVLAPYAVDPDWLMPRAVRVYLLCESYGMRLKRHCIRRVLK